MRLKEIKPGMVIHCNTKEEATSLKNELDKLGYVWITGCDIKDSTIWGRYKDICLLIHENKKATWDYADDSIKTITEFSDLIIPELSAKEVLEIVGEICERFDSCGDNCGCPLDSEGICLCRPEGFGKSLESKADKLIEICTKWREEHPKEEKKVEVEQFWEIKCLEDPSYHTTEHYKDEAEAFRMCVILAEKDPKNSYYAVFVAKAKE